MKHSRWIVLPFAALVGGMVPALANVGVPRADALDFVEILGPEGSDDFGHVTVLPNGNFVVTDPRFSLPGVEQVGAVYLYNGSTNALISRLTGGNEDDRVGDGGITPVGQSHFVVLSRSWNNGAIVEAGAATWVNGATGLDGQVSTANSLVGSHEDDFTEATVTTLTNGNYVVATPYLFTGDQGAATWGDGATGVTGGINDATSLVGNLSGDRVALGGVVALTNGHYVVNSPSFSRGIIANVGAATWANGATGSTVGAVLETNSTYGPGSGDGVSSRGTIALANGNYVVLSPEWSNNTGAATWRGGDGSGTGPVSAANSMTGAGLLDSFGDVGIALTNGNYVVSTTRSGGKARWGDGATGTTGVTTTANSIHGTNFDDQVGNELFALTNGNYLVASEEWNNARGSVSWADGSGPIAFEVSAANSLVGANQGDEVSSGGVTPLANGNYVVSSRSWDKGLSENVGAVTWGNGAIGTTGEVGESNSLTGTQPGDQVGDGGVLGLTNSNFQVLSTFWNGQSAITWGDGTVATSGVVSAGNSVTGAGLVYGSADALGVALPDGSAAIAISENINVVTLVGGSGPATGVISDANSVFGIGDDSGDSISIGERFTASGAVAAGWSEDNRVVLIMGAASPNPNPNPNPNPGPTPDFVPVPSARLADTRPGGTTVDGQFAAIGLRAAGSTLELTVNGRGGVPANAAGVALNVTVTNPQAELFITVFPCGDTRPTASNINALAGAVVSNAVLARVGTGGKVCIYTSQPAHLVVDVNGYFPAGTRYQPLNPARLVDTRPGQPTVDGQQAGIGKRAANSQLTVVVNGRGGAPAGASAAVLNITATGADLAGFVTVWPCDVPRPTASSVNVTPGVTHADLVVARTSATGEVCIFVQSPMHLIVDLNGYFPMTSSLTPLVPARLLDTRADHPTIDGLFKAAGVRPAGSVTQVTVTGRGGVPANATTVAVNVTVTEPAAAGYVTIYPCGGNPPLASNINYAAGQTIPNAALVKVGTGGQICIYTQQATHLVADVTGSFSD